MPGLSCQGCPVRVEPVEQSFHTKAFTIGLIITTTVKQSYIRNGTFTVNTFASQYKHKISFRYEKAPT